MNKLPWMRSQSIERAVKAWHSSERQGLTLFVVGAFAISFTTLSPLAFYAKSPLVFYRFDGTYLLILAAMQKTWAIGGWNFTSNPLQGIGGLGLPEQALLDPSLWLTTKLSPLLGPVVAMTLYAGALGFAICWLGLRIGVGPLASVAAAWIGILLAFPYVYPSLGFDFLWGVPAYIPFIVLNVAVLLLSLDLGRGPRTLDAARVLGMGAILTYELAQYPNFVPVSLIVLSFFGLLALIAAGCKRARRIQLACGVVFALFVLAVFGEMLYGLWGFSKATFFWYEFLPRTADLRDQSFFIAMHSRWPAWLVYGMSLLGALYAAFRGTTTLRVISRSFLLFVFAGAIMVLATSQGGWKGPRIAYIDIFAYPFYCLFAAYAVVAAATALRLPKLTSAISREPGSRATARAHLPRRSG